jgi:hypothetical protein
MSDIRLKDPATRFYLASPRAFANWKVPTSAELNANPTNNPNGLIWNLTCALDRANTSFDLGDAETDDSLSFCQVYGTSSPTSYNPEIVFSFFRSLDPWVISTPASLNTANLALSLMMHRDNEYFAILSKGERSEVNFAPGHEIKMARVATVDLVDGIGSGEMVTGTQNFAKRGDVLWNHTLTV